MWFTKVLFQSFSRFFKILFNKRSNKNNQRIYNGFTFHLMFFLWILFSEIEKFQGPDGKNEDEEEKYLDVISNKNIKLSERVLIPVKQYPKVLQYMLFNLIELKKMMKIRWCFIHCLYEINVQIFILLIYTNIWY